MLLSLIHIFICGGTGGGKTYFLLTIIEALLRTNADLYILDPKNADLADLGTVMGNVYQMCIRDRLMGVGFQIKIFLSFFGKSRKFNVMLQAVTGNVHDVVAPVSYTHLINR